MLLHYARPIASPAPEPLTICLFQFEQGGIDAEFVDTAVLEEVVNRDAFLVFEDS